MKLHIIDEAERCLKCKKPLCQQGCPIHTPIPQITQLLLENRLMEAGEILLRITQCLLSAPQCVTMKINVKAIVF